MSVIERAEVFVCSPGRNFVTLRITTSDGVTGLGDATLNGRELAVAVRRHHPALPILLLTGDTDAEAEDGDVDAVVKKPYTLDALDTAVRRLVGRDAATEAGEPAAVPG